MVQTFWMVRQVRAGFRPEIEPFLVQPADARAAARFVNGHILANDLVIASPNLAWLVRGNRADLQMAIAATGQAVPDLPAKVPLARFAFDPRLPRARFVIVDNFWRAWGVWNVPGATELMRQVETWPLVFRAGEIEVYCNPTLGCEF